MKYYERGGCRGAYWVGNFTNEMLRLAMGLNIDGNEIKVAKCIGKIDGRLCFSKVRGRVLKDYMEGGK